MLSNNFKMPSVSTTILHGHSFFTISSGFSIQVLTLLKKKIEDMSAMDRKCVLLFDEFSSTMELEYSTKDDLVYGFVDFGSTGRKNLIASSNLIVMIRGLNKNWKQAICYFIGSPTGSELAEILRESFAILRNVGFDLVASTSDQGSTNRAALKKLGVTKEQPQVKVHEEPVTFLFDVPHLFKSVRNCLLKNEIIFDDSKIASWKILEKLYSIDTHFIRMLHKLTDKHIRPDAFNKMSV